MHAHIAVDSPVPARAAGNWIYDVVHDSIHIALNIQVDHVNANSQWPIFNSLLPEFRRRRDHTLSALNGLQWHRNPGG